MGKDRRDATDRLLAELRATMGKMELALDAIGESIAWTDTQGRVQWCNAAFERLIGRPRIAILGRAFSELIRLEHDGMPVGWPDHPISHAVAQGSTPAATYRSPRFDRARFLEVSAASFRSGAEAATIGVVIRDVTDRAHAEDARARALASAEAANRAKTEFLARMSHELRTPLNAIIGFSDLMRLRQADASGDVTVPLDWVGHINQGGENLLALVNDLLDLSKIEAERLELELEPFEMGAAVTQCVAGLRPLADRKDITVELDIPAGTSVIADRGRFRQILANLLSNAIRHSPDGGRIAVSGQRSGGQVMLSVSDGGVGIAPQDQPFVFEEFRQFGSHRQDGTGLGLALTRRLVEAHGGRIALRSEPGVGSTFTVTLRAPLDEVDTERPALAERRPRSSDAPGDILVVEDDPSAAGLMRAYLEPEGYRVRIATNGEAAIAETQREPPTAILLDVLLPGMYGWDVLRRLKADPGLHGVPVIVVSIIDEPEGGQALGADDYLVKPVDRLALLSSLRRLGLRPGPD